MKKCSNCKTDKEIEFFGLDNGRLDGRNVYCLDCTRSKRQTNRDKINSQKRQDYWDRHDYHLQQRQNDYFKHKDQRLEYSKQYYQENSDASKKRASDYYYHNKEKVSIQSKKYRLKNAEIIKQKKREYYQRPDIKAISRQKNKEWKKNNPEKRREMEKCYFEKDPIRKIIKGMRTRIFTVLKRSGAHKAGRTIDQLGCTPEFLKQHIESKFYSRNNDKNETIQMTWDNFGNGPETWQIDHIRSLCLFDLTNPAEQLIANHYLNLQPLWFNDHIIKSQKDLNLRKESLNLAEKPLNSTEELTF